MTFPLARLSLAAVLIAAAACTIEGGNDVVSVPDPAKTPVLSADCPSGKYIRKGADGWTCDAARPEAGSIGATELAARAVSGDKLADGAVATAAVAAGAVTLEKLGADVSDKLLAKTDAAGTYLAKTDASATYLGRTDAASTYLGKTDAASTYLGKTDAANTYLGKSDAAGTYLAKAGAPDFIAQAGFVSTETLAGTRADNLAINSSFELVGAGGAPAAWTAIGTPTAGMAIGTVASTLFGNLALEVRDGDNTAAISVGQVVIGSGSIAAYRGRTATVSIHARRTAGISVGTICVGEDDTTAPTDCADLSTSDTFTRTTLRHEVSAGATVLRVVLAPGKVAADANNYQYDGLMVTFGPANGTWEPAWASHASEAIYDGAIRTPQLANGAVTSDKISGPLADGLLAGTYSSVLVLTNASNVLSGNGTALTALNADNLALGTLPSGRLAGTYSNPVSLSNTANTLAGNGAAVTALSASNLASGTVPDARLSGTYTGAISLSNAGNTFAGNGSALTGINASNIASGNVPDGRLATQYAQSVRFTNATNTFSGNGAGLTSLNASNLASGTVPLSVLSQAGASTSGYLSTGDWAAFNAASLASADLLRNAQLDDNSQWLDTPETVLDVMPDGRQLRVHYSRQTLDGAACYNWAYSKPVPVKALRTYKASIWIRTEDTGMSNYFGFRAYDANGNTIDGNWANPYFKVGGGDSAVYRPITALLLPSDADDADGNGVADRQASATNGTEWRMPPGTAYISLRFGSCYKAGPGYRSFFAMPSLREVRAEDALDGWQTPTMQNGWVNYDATYNPAGYRIDGQGRVTLRGLIKNGIVGNAAFVLPPGFAPAYRELRPVQTNANTIGRVDIDTNGNVFMYAVNSAWASLDGITFYAAGH